MNMSGQPRILCMSSYEKGQAFMQECAALGCRVVLLTVDKLRERTGRGRFSKS